MHLLSVSLLAVISIIQLNAASSLSSLNSESTNSMLDDRTHAKMTKRFNFNFMRTWVPLANNFEPVPIRNYGSYDSERVENVLLMSPEEEERQSEQRLLIQRRLLCMAALANPAACNEI